MNTRRSGEGAPAAPEALSSSGLVSYVRADIVRELLDAIKQISISHRWALANIDKTKAIGVAMVKAELALESK